MSYLLINHDDSRSVFEELDLPGEFSDFLDSCRDFLKCFSVQTAPTRLRGIVLVFSDELHVGWRNSINKVASDLAVSFFSPIVGDAILARLDGTNVVPLTSDCSHLIPLTSADIELLKRRFS